MIPNDGGRDNNRDSKEAVIRKTSRIPIWKSRSQSYPGDVAPRCPNFDNVCKSTNESHSNSMKFQGTEFSKTSKRASSFITSHRDVEFVDNIRGNVWSPKLDLLSEATTKSIKTIHSVKFFSEDLQHIEDEILNRKESIENETVGVLYDNETSSLVDLKPPRLEKFTAVTQEETRTLRRIRSFVNNFKQRVSTLSVTPHTIFRKSSTGDISYNVLENSFAKDVTRSEESGEKTHEYTTGLEQKNMQQARAENRHYPNAEAAHFLDMLQQTRKDLQEKCGKWNMVLQGPVMPSLSGEIRSVIGQARLLISERFQQFEGLVHKFVNPLPGDKAILKTDLEGFWEMISYQIKDVNAKFENLEKYKERRRSSTRNPAKEEKAARVAGVSKTTAYLSPAGSKSSKHYKDDAKKRLKEAKNAMKERVSKREKQGEESERILNDSQMD